MKSSHIIQYSPLELTGDYKPLITSPFGSRVRQGKEEFHHGVDMVISHKNRELTGPISCCFDRGVIVFAAPYGSAGNAVIIMDLESSTRLQRVLACYCHLDAIYDNAGDIVVRNERIGYMGGTGITKNQYQPHLHFSFHILEKDVPVERAISGYGARNPLDFGLQNIGFASPEPSQDKNIILEELSKTHGI